MNVQLHLDQLYRKPMPNKKQKQGVEVHFFGQRDRNTLTKAKEVEVELEEERPLKEKPSILIRDSRAVKN